MSYGMVYIQSDINRMKKKGATNSEIVDVIGRRIKVRYPRMSKDQCEDIVRKSLNKEDITSRDWHPELDKPYLQGITISNFDSDMRKWNLPNL